MLELGEKGLAYLLMTWASWNCITLGHQVPEGPGWPVHHPQAHRRREARPGLHLQEPGHRMPHRLQGELTLQLLKLE